MQTCRNDAAFSPCRIYRYALWRHWCEAKPKVLFIGLNPSTADEKHNDPTIRRCIGFAHSWGFGALCVANLFAYCATKPENLMQAEDPIGATNDHWLADLAKGADRVIACWGNLGAFKQRASEVRDLLDDLYCIKLNRSGEPAHPLYMKADLFPVPLAPDPLPPEPQARGK